MMTLQTCVRRLVGATRRTAAILLAVAGCVVLSSATIRAEVFTLAILGDAQTYVGGPNDAAGDLLAAGFTAQTQWIVNNAAAENIVFVTQDGDVVEHGNVALEWQRANASMSVLDSLPSLPWSTTAGNHELNVPDSLGSGFSTYLANFGPQRHADKSWFGGSDLGVGGGQGLNTWQTFTGNGRQYLHMSLEFDAPDAAIGWAQSVLDAHPGMPTIVTTHTLLTDERPGTFPGSGPLALTPSPYLGGVGRNSGEQIFDKLIRGNEQIFLTVNGHYCCERQLTTTNDAGLPVHHFQVDYSRSPNGGDGWIQMLRFDEEAGEIRVETYTPGVPLNPNPRFDTDADSQFTIAMDWGVRFDGEDPGPDPPSTAPAGIDGVFDFQQGVAGYNGTFDTWFSHRSTGGEVNGNPELGYIRTAKWGDPPNSGANQQSLLRFDNIFGDGPRQIPAGTPIAKATLIINVADLTFAEGEANAIHQMLLPWLETDTYGGEQWAGGASLQIDRDGIEAATTPVADGTAFAIEPGQFNGGTPNTQIPRDSAMTFDVTAIVAAWSAGDPNYGFLFQSLGLDGGGGLFMDSSETSQVDRRPKLSIEVDIERPSIVEFQQGVDHGYGLYTGGVDGTITSEAGLEGDANFGGAVMHVVDTADGEGAYVKQGVIRFDDVIGDGEGQIPEGAEIIAASLTLATNRFPGDGSAATHALHRILVQWEQGGWNNADWGGDGIQTNDVDALISADASIAGPISDEAILVFDVKESLQAWANGDANLGWLIEQLLDGDDEWQFASNENSDSELRPILSVSYSVPDRIAGDVDGDGDVDRADLAAMVRGYGKTSGANPDDGDFNRDRAVTLLDLAQMQRNFGAVEEPPADSPAAVPEPSSCMLLLAGMLALAASRRAAGRKN